jgi:F-box-like
MNDSTLPTIESLPNETLGDILLDVVEGEGFPSDVRRKCAALLQLGLVCHRWHETIISEPRFWTHSAIDILEDTTANMDMETKHKSDQASVEALEAFYSRSGSSLGLSILCFCDHTPPQPGLKNLTSRTVSCRAEKPSSCLWPTDGSRWSLIHGI